MSTSPHVFMYLAPAGCRRYGHIASWFVHPLSLWNSEFRIAQPPFWQDFLGLVGTPFSDPSACLHSNQRGWISQLYHVRPPIVMSNPANIVTGAGHRNRPEAVTFGRDSN